METAFTIITLQRQRKKKKISNVKISLPCSNDKVGFVLVFLFCFFVFYVPLYIRFSCPLYSMRCFLSVAQKKLKGTFHERNLEAAIAQNASFLAFTCLKGDGNGRSQVSVNDKLALQKEAT